jgi:hypothetical protein
VVDIVLGQVFYWVRHTNDRWQNRPAQNAFTSMMRQSVPVDRNICIEVLYCYLMNSRRLFDA